MCLLVLGLLLHFFHTVNFFIQNCFITKNGKLSGEIKQIIIIQGVPERFAVFKLLQLNVHSRSELLVFKNNNVPHILEVETLNFLKVLQAIIFDVLTAISNFAAQSVQKIIIERRMEHVFVHIRIVWVYDLQIIIMDLVAVAYIFMSIL